MEREREKETYTEEVVDYGQGTVIRTTNRKKETTRETEETVTEVQDPNPREIDAGRYLDPPPQREDYDNMADSEAAFLTWFQSATHMAQTGFKQIAADPKIPKEFGKDMLTTTINSIAMPIQHGRAMSGPDSTKPKERERPGRPNWRAVMKSRHRVLGLRAAWSPGGRCLPRCGLRVGRMNPTGMDAPYHLRTSARWKSWRIHKARMPSW